ncbi:MAG: helix-turn-helix transcriptional regulator [Betaproteobacteria bacterium]|nr:helix-turn-helix transcriptional regulator [Betaproteobacteria bacterium]
MRSGAAKVSDGLGPRLRLVREQSEVTVRELARRIGVSPSLVSQVERGLAMPSVGTLLAIANELTLDIGDLFKGGARSAQAAHGPVQRRASRKAIRMASGVRWERLTATPDSEVEFLYAVYDAGSASCGEDSMLRHGGKEYAYVLSGRLGVKIGFEEYELGPGDAISFDAQMPHRLWCIGSQPAVGIWTIIRRHGDARRPLNTPAVND